MFLTDFADAAVTLPVSILVAIFLAIRGAPGSARAWVAGVGTTFAVVLLAKLAFGFIPLLGRAIDVASPSGHTAAATVVYGGMVLILTGRAAASMLAAAAVASIIAASRLALDVHTAGEVVIGAVIGLAGMALLERLWPRILGRPAVPGVVARLVLVVLAACVIAWRHGAHAPFEYMLDTLELHETVGDDPF